MLNSRMIIVVDMWIIDGWKRGMPFSISILISGYEMHVLHQAACTASQITSKSGINIDKHYTMSEYIERNYYIHCEVPKLRYYISDLFLIITFHPH